MMAHHFRSTPGPFAHIAVRQRPGQAAEFSSSVRVQRASGGPDIAPRLHARRRDQHGLLNFKERVRPIAIRSARLSAPSFRYQSRTLPIRRRKSRRGGNFFFDLCYVRAVNSNAIPDPPGVIFGISKHGWQGTDGYQSSGVCHTTASCPALCRDPHLRAVKQTRWPLQALQTWNIRASYPNFIRPLHQRLLASISADHRVDRRSTRHRLDAALTCP